jgi:hypothetical protein
MANEEVTPLLQDVKGRRNSPTIEQFSKEKVVNIPASTVFLMLNIMIGAGFLVQPYAFKKSGIILSTFFYMIFGYATYR